MGRPVIKTNNCWSVCFSTYNHLEDLLRAVKTSSEQHLCEGQNRVDVRGSEVTMDRVVGDQRKVAGICECAHTLTHTDLLMYLMYDWRNLHPQVSLSGFRCRRFLLTKLPCFACAFPMAVGQCSTTIFILNIHFLLGWQKSFYMSCLTSGLPVEVCHVFVGQLCYKHLAHLI